MNTPTPWGYKFSEGGGYDCMTDAFRIVCPIQKEGDYQPIATLDLFDYGQAWCKPSDEKCMAKARANAALIVRAVNSHQSLIDALEKIIKADAYRMAAIAAPDGEKHYEPATENFWAAIDKGRAALALAKEPT